MKNKKTRRVVKATIILSWLYTANTIGLPLLIKKGTISQLKVDKITQFMKTSEYCCQYQGNEQEKAEKYLKLAHMITMNNITLKNMSFEDYKDKKTEDLLEARIGDCSETSEYTYANYLGIIKNTGQINLAEYVRYASGHIIINNTNKKSGHAWLELKMDNEWMPYETTRLDINNGMRIDPYKVPDALTNRMVINLPQFRYEKEVHIQMAPDGKITSKLYGWNCLKNYEGLIGAVIRTCLFQN